MDPSTLLLSGAIVLLVLLVARRWAPIRFPHVPGPPSTSFWHGAEHQFLNQRDGVEYQQSLARKYGTVVRVPRGFLKSDMLYICDPVALTYLLKKEPDVLEQSVVQQEATRLVHGPSLLSSSGATHQKHRRLLGPVFTSAHIRRLRPVFFDVANELAHSLAARCTATGTADVDILGVLSQTALELIGRGVLGHSFAGDNGRLNAALKDMLASRYVYIHWWPLLRPLRLLFSQRLLRAVAVNFRTAAAQRLRNNIDTLTETLVDIFESKKKIVAANPRSVETSNDIITHLLHANETAAPQDRQSEEELRAHMAVMITAGRDTVGHITARILQALATRPDVQQRLRDEILHATAAAGSSDPDFTTLNEMAYLDAVIRETMRLWPTIGAPARIVQRDTVTPLSGALGGTASMILPAGTTIRIGVHNANRIPELWGPDGDSFRPERWFDAKNGFDPTLSEAYKDQDLSLPGVWSNTMTFMGGPRSCIGFRFALCELKVLLVVLLQQFEVLPAPDTHRIEWYLGSSNTPYVCGREDEGPMLPVRLKLCHSFPSA